MSDVIVKCSSLETRDFKTKGFSFTVYKEKKLRKASDEMSVINECDKCRNMAFICHCNNNNNKKA